MTKSELKEIIKECIYEYKYQDNYLFNETYNISSKQILEIFGDFDVDNYIEPINEISISSVISKFGIDFGQFNAITNDISKRIAREIKENGINEKTKKSISSIIIDFYNKLIKLIEGNDLYQLKFAKYDANKIRKSIFILLQVIFINTISEKILSIILGPIPGIAISTCIIAPIAEEFGKYASIKGHYEKEYFIVFNAAEFGLYTSSLYKAGTSLSKAIANRLIGVGAHLSFTIIQWIFNNKKLRKILNIDDTEDGKKKASFIGIICTTLLHCCWNSFAMISALSKLHI